jgi:hypothetical protein
MQEPTNKTKANLEKWCSTEGKSFSSPEAEEAYKKRARRIADVTQLKLPDRVPIIPTFGTFPINYCGFNAEEGMFDPVKAVYAFKKVLLELQPDVYESPIFTQGPFYEALGYRPLLLPGRGIPSSVNFQFIEAEYVKAEEFYDHFLDDPSDFILRVFLPRVCGIMAPFKQLRPLHENISYYLGIGPNISQFNQMEIVGALENLKKASDVASELRKPVRSFESFALSSGFPPFYGGGTAAPYDVIGDFIRGTKGIMLDMYHRPEKLLAVMNKLVPYLIDMGLQAKNSQSYFIAIPLHKHSEGFMSQEQFKTFFWSPLRKVMMGLIEEGLIPVPFFEGETTARLEVIRDIPRAKAIYQFQNVDLHKAKEILGDVACFRGNVPVSLLHTGSPEQVKSYVKYLINVIGEGGGLIVNAGSVIDNAKFETLKAMFDATLEYGVYN